MRKYLVKVTSVTYVYVEADDPEEATERAAEAAWQLDADNLETEILEDKELE